MRSRLSAVVTTLVAAVALAVLAGVAYMYSGLYNVAAIAPHNALSRWVLQTAQKNSVQAHAEKVGTPPQLSLAAAAANIIDEMRADYGSA